MGFKTQDVIKQEIIDAVQGAENFDDMMAKAATYVQANYEPKAEAAEVVDEETELVSIN